MIAGRRRCSWKRTSAGITMLFIAIVLSASDSTMTMLVAAEKPPRKTRSERYFIPCAERQGEHEVVRAAAPRRCAGARRSAIGSTKMLIRKR